MATLLARGTLLYLGAVNTYSIVLFGFDKYKASSRAWRISERRLCSVARAGGWVGGLVAMQLFRHKTRKQSFQAKYLEAISANLMIALPAILVIAAVSPLRSAFGDASRGLLKRFAAKKPPKRNHPRFRR